MLLQHFAPVAAVAQTDPGDYCRSTILCSTAGWRLELAAHVTCPSRPFERVQQAVQTRWPGGRLRHFLRADDAAPSQAGGRATSGGVWGRAGWLREAVLTVVVTTIPAPILSFEEFASNPSLASSLFCGSRLGHLTSCHPGSSTTSGVAPCCILQGQRTG